MFVNILRVSSNPSQQQDPNRPPPGAAIPPNGSGSDMPGSQGGPLTPMQQGKLTYRSIRKQFLPYQRYGVFDIFLTT